MIEKNRLQVMLTFGGRSEENGVSLISASNIAPHFNPEKYDLRLLYITREGRWILCDSTLFKMNCDDPEEILATIKGDHVYLPVGQGGDGHLCKEDTSDKVGVDLFFNLLHGINGAGGRMQGLWTIAGIPFTGPSTLGGAAGFDKDVMKRLLSQAGLPICRYLTIDQEELTHGSAGSIVHDFSYPFFIKPANSGSSLGVHKIYNEDEFKAKIRDVFRYDTKLILEEYIDGSELEIYCFKSRTGMKTSVVRQTIVGENHEFYTYEAKYGSDNASDNTKHIPAKIPEKDIKRVEELAVEAYRALEGRGEVRIDLFYSSKGKIYINEINTVPSMMSPESQPSLWSARDLARSDIIDDLVLSALAEYNTRVCRN